MVLEERDLTADGRLIGRIQHLKTHDTFEVLATYYEWLPYGIHCAAHRVPVSDPDDLDSWMEAERIAFRAAQNKTRSV